MPTADGTQAARVGCNQLPSQSFGGCTLANIKSQIKRNRQNLKRRLRNRSYRGAARSAVLQARASIEAGEPDSRASVLEAISMLDKAAERGVLHRNNAARRKARLMRRLAAVSASTTTAAPSAAGGAEKAKIEQPQEASGEKAGKTPASRKAVTKKADKKSATK